MLIRIGSNGFWARRDSPSESLEETARMFNQINGQIIVEIGSGVHGKLAGNSVLTWAKKTRAKRIITVDLDPKQIRVELEDSKRALEEIIGKPIAHFSCPGGRVNRYVTQIAVESGYETVATSQLGANSSTSNRFALTRVAIKRDMNLKTFAKVCSGKGQFLMRSEDSILFVGKRILGNERYDRLRSTVLSIIDRRPASSDN